ncbi:MAG TPA: hypothetical protein VK738_14845 [Terriglobales bacterium]|jgi:hypothetical protein|nr:hypothetical protein [Terriglobales bacterium]
MIPLLAVIRVAHKPHSCFRLWLPLFLLWMVLLPLMLLLAPLICVVCLAQQVDPFRALRALWQMLCALRGAKFEVNHRNSLVFLNIF